MTVLGSIFAIMYAISLWWGKRGVVTVMVLATAVFDSAALNAGPISLSPFYLGAVILTCLTLPGIRRGDALADFRPLKYLLVYATVVTAIGPAVFAGFPVIASGVSIDKQVGQPAALAYNLSNFAQIAYLSLNTVFVLSSMRHDLVRRGAVTTSFWIGTVIGSVAAVGSFASFSWPGWLFQNSNRALYALDPERVWAQFTEPSHFGAYSVVAFAYFTVLSFQNNKLSVFGALLAFVNVVVSGAGTALVALVILLPVALLVGVKSLAHARSREKIVLAFAYLTTALVVYAVLRAGDIVPSITHLLNQKIKAGSIGNRAQADAMGFHTFLDSFGLGVGLGSNRTSSLALLLLSTIGVAGTLLFSASLIICIHRGWSTPSSTPAVAGLLAFISAAVVSFPDFANPVMWMLIAFILGQTRLHAGSKEALSSEDEQSLQADSRAASRDSAIDDFGTPPLRRFDRGLSRRSPRLHARLLYGGAG